mmetsp:Transcript_28323/g.58003  ORF Transcript_28323/g.58003 Transcript_28323/m.58003 type:complete len:558 (+) Transcript_28323:266-1939(+)|eukprot:CAMPEP_0171623322 /NCGR_PEP_ID=MMETSP0990-20121206/17870_1 /TAXON_ID=483369 /ORGANISM="non described non described, Strain CCMP2098" /LENGTH=557 /DNA_ID=CAMNT_0012189489 /DNA_START=160 /DNA_END=1833 /DNA_ORIENTATION=-
MPYFRALARHHWARARPLLADAVCRQRPAITSGVAKVAVAATGGAAVLTTLACSSESWASGEEKTYEAAEVAGRDGANGRPLWVTFNGGVFDITNFLKKHPGGSQFVKSAAGGPIEPWWRYWAYHNKSKDNVEALLSKYRIGRLAEWDPEEFDDIDLFDDEPARNLARSKHLIMVDEPLNTETWTSVLKKTYFTPSEVLYIRNHAPVPAEVNPEKHCVDFVLGTADQPFLIRSLKLGEIASGPELSVPAVLQCAGNRAADNIRATGPTGYFGTKFENMGVGMVGCGVWGGVALQSILETVYGDLLRSGGDDLWVEFHGLDGYFTSIPLAIVLDKHREALLATHLNGNPLSRDHGFPVRVFLPGVIGARSVKWLSKVVLRYGEGQSPWNKQFYKAQLPGKTERLKDMPSAMELPLNSLILSNDASASQPGGNHFLHQSGKRVLSGVAYSGFTGDQVSAVQISKDQGESWQDAKMERWQDDKKAVGNGSDSGGRGNYHWVRWELMVDCTGVKEVWCRAFTASGEFQPKEPKPNPGFLFNGYHKVDVMALSKGLTRSLQK